MTSKVIVKEGTNICPVDKVNQAIKRLGGGWRVVSANTTTTIYRGIGPGFQMREAQHCKYVITVVVQKD